MTTPGDRQATGYHGVYREFDSPAMRAVRREAYGEDIGQHSWVTAPELRADLPALALAPSARLLDFGCGPGGPLTFALTVAGCHGTGVDQDSAALDLARSRARTLGVGHRLELRACDLEAPLPFGPATFETAMALDVVLHLRDRQAFFRETARLLVPGGRFLVIDAGIVTGSLSDEEIARRGVNGPTYFVAPGWTEAALDAAGFRVLAVEDRTTHLAQVAAARREALRRHQNELSDQRHLADQLAYLDVVVALAERRALSRLRYLAERKDDPL